MNEKKKLTHRENETIETKTPQLRVEHYGAKNYLVGENVLKTEYGVTINGKKGKEFNTKTYNGLSSSIVNGWVNSPGHYQNIITSAYEITGITVSINKKENKLYVCQKFATVQYQYAFEESKTMFPYSDYVPSPVKNDFIGINNELINYKYEWKVKHNRLEKCHYCSTVLIQKPPIALRYHKKSFILRVENSDYVKKLIRNKKDGFAVEIVEYDDYDCGNPAYYTKPSRRNGQIKLNGRLLEPIYRNDLYKGYKKRRKNKEITFLSYVFSADSVPFFKRFYRYKLANFSSEYFEIKLGKLPKDISGYWNHNLIYLQDQQICNVDYFTGYCGELYEDSTKPILLPFDTIGNYKFTLDTQSLSFDIPFERNKANYTHQDIDPFLNSISNLDFTVDSIYLMASSSVEGDSIGNTNLQLKRAQSIIGVFQNHQIDSIQTRIETFTDWDHFYESVKASSKWRKLSNLDKPELVTRLNKGLADTLEHILQEERKAHIDLYCTLELTDANLEYYIKKEYGGYIDSLYKTGSDDPKNEIFLHKLHRLYRFTHKKVVEGKIDTLVLANLAIPNYYNSSIWLCEKFILYGYKYPNAYDQNITWKNYRKKLIAAILVDNSRRASPEFLYAYAYELTENLSSKKKVNEEDIGVVLNYLERLKRYYQSNKESADNIDKINFNLNMVLLNNAWIDNPTANSAEAYKSISIIYSYYLSRKMMNDSLAFKLAKLAVHYQNNMLALQILQPYMDKEYIEAYAIPLQYQHPSSENSVTYFQYLINLSEIMSRNNWCNLFLNNCQIPFQAFDHEELRNTFCEKCQGSNEFLKELKN